MSLFEPARAGLQDFEIHAVHDFFLFGSSPLLSVAASLSATGFAVSPDSTDSACTPPPPPVNCSPRRLKNSPASLRAAPSTSREPICASLPPTCAVAV